MDLTTPAGAVAAALAGLVVVLSLALVVGARSRRRARDEALAAREETVRLAAQVAALGEQVAQVRAQVQAQPVAREAAYVITDAGAPGRDSAPAPMVRDTLVLNAALGEPLVKAAAFTHGVRRALAPQSRARIRVAVRQETRRVRKERRREMRAVWLAHKRATRAAATDPATARAA